MKFCLFSASDGECVFLVPSVETDYFSGACRATQRSRNIKFLDKACKSSDLPTVPPAGDTPALHYEDHTSITTVYQIFCWGMPKPEEDTTIVLTGWVVLKTQCVIGVM